MFAKEQKNIPVLLKNNVEINTTLKMILLL